MEKTIVTNIAKIILCGKDEYKTTTSSFGKDRPYQELTLYLSGKTTVYFDDQIVTTSKDKVCYLPDGKHSQYIVERQESGDCIIVYFNSVTPLNDKVFVLDPQNGKLETLFKKLLSVWRKRDEGYYLESMSLFYKILSELQKSRYCTDAQFKKIEPAAEYVKTHFLTETISAQKLSELCGISYSYVKKLFVLKYGATPKRFCIHLKMNYACSLLTESGYSVSQTAEACGYSDVYFFSHQFKEYVGVSPANFVKSYKSSK